MLAIGAIEHGISGSDTGIRRRFFVQHDLDKHVDSRVCRHHHLLGRGPISTLALGSWILSGARFSSYPMSIASRIPFERSSC